jgi:RHS repeat-associated protein
LVRKDPAGRTLYLPGQEVRLTASTGVKSCTRYFTHAGQLVATWTAGKLSWLSSDHNGTTGITVDSSNLAVGIRRSMSFGETRGTAPNWLPSFDKGFVGGTNDNTGLTHLGARGYDPVIGRFISVDPLMDLADVRQWNAYAYASNSPVMFSDPSGLVPMMSCDDMGGNCSAHHANDQTMNYPTPKTVYSKDYNNGLAAQANVVTVDQRRHRAARGRRRPSRSENGRVHAVVSE